ncbi:MAG: hypothetical protein ACYC1K_03335 [Minisyncoccota bacterium]
MAKKVGLGNISGGKTGKKINPWNNIFNPLSNAAKNSNLHPLSKDGWDKNPMWNNYFNPLSKKVLDLRADPSGTSSVGRTAKKKAQDAARLAEEARQKAVKQTAFDAKYPTVPVWRSSPGIPPQWYKPTTYNPALSLRGYSDFGAALAPNNTTY